MRQKILVSFDVEVSDSSDVCCLETCPFVVVTDHVAGAGHSFLCRLFGEFLEDGQGTLRRLPQCLRAVGNHNILGKCLAGE